METSLSFQQRCIIATKYRLVNGVWKQDMQRYINSRMEQKLSECPNDKCLQFDVKLVNEMLIEVVEKADVSIFENLKHALGIFNQSFCENKSQFENVWYALFHYSVENIFNAHFNALTFEEGIGEINLRPDGSVAIESLKITNGLSYLTELEKRWDQHVTVHDVIDENKKQSYYHIIFVLDIAKDLYNLPVEKPH